MELEDFKRSLLQKQNPPIQVATPVVLELHHSVDLQLYQECSSCGGRMSLPKSDLRVIRSFGYVKDRRPKEKVQKYEVSQGDEVEL